MRFVKARVATILTVLSLSASAQPPAKVSVKAPAKVQVGIIIDDLGYRLDMGRRAIELPGPVACAILPGTPRAKHLAETAYRYGKEVLVHLPLQAIAGRKPEEVEGISLDMSRARFSQTVNSAIDSVPFAIGINNHRGSLLTRHPGHMRWLMDDIRKRDGLFFIDSYTTHHSVALQIASEAGVPALKRDVFLDTDPAPESVAKEFARLKLLARERGAAIAIGHPYPATLEFLEQELPRLADEGIEMVAISELIRAMSKSSAGGGDEKPPNYDELQSHAGL